MDWINRRKSHLCHPALLNLSCTEARPELRAEVVFLVENKDTDTSCHFSAGVIKLGGDCDRGIDKVTASASDCSNLTSLLIVKLIRKHI